MFWLFLGENNVDIFEYLGNWFELNLYFSWVSHHSFLLLALSSDSHFKKVRSHVIQLSLHPIVFYFFLRNSLANSNHHLLPIFQIFLIEFIHQQILIFLRLDGQSLTRQASKL